MIIIINCRTVFTLRGALCFLPFWRDETSEEKIFNFIATRLTHTARICLKKLVYAQARNQNFAWGKMNQNLKIFCISQTGVWGWNPQLPRTTGV